VRRRAAHSFQQRQEEVDQWRRRMQMQYLNDRASYHRIAFSYELDIQYDTSCEFVQIGKMDNVCPQCTAMKFKGKAPEMCCVSGKVKLSELE